MNIRVYIETLNLSYERIVMMLDKIFLFATVYEISDEFEEWQWYICAVTITHLA